LKKGKGIGLVLQSALFVKPKMELSLALELEGIKDFAKLC
jgi:hypothetical protein